MSTEQLEELREFVDWHLDRDTLNNGDCGCPDDKIEAWQKQERAIGDQAFRDHVYEELKAKIERFNT